MFALIDCDIRRLEEFQSRLVSQYYFDVKRMFYEKKRLINGLEKLLGLHSACIRYDG